jgi:hypothetical protein
MAKIFISYRRADASDATGRIFDRLVAAFGERAVFKDVDSIPLGSDFANVIAEQLNDCNVVIVVIGRFWLTVRGQDGAPRLHNPADYVRIEVEQALNSRALVIPVLVGNVAMPSEAQLPESIRQLARKHAVSIRPDPDFHRDMDRLVRSLIEHFKQKKSRNVSPVSPARQALNRVTAQKAIRAANIGILSGFIGGFILGICLLSASRSSGESIVGFVVFTFFLGVFGGSVGGFMGLLIAFIRTYYDPKTKSANQSDPLRRSSLILLIIVGIQAIGLF